MITYYCCAESANTSSEVIPLQPIIDAAQNGNTITLAPGTYIGKGCFSSLHKSAVKKSQQNVFIFFAPKNTFKYEIS
jgi:hypothetical protein